MILAAVIILIVVYAAVLIFMNAAKPSENSDKKFDGRA